MTFTGQDRTNSLNPGVVPPPKKNKGLDGHAAHRVVVKAHFPAWG